MTFFVVGMLLLLFSLREVSMIPRGIERAT